MFISQDVSLTLIHTQHSNFLFTSNKPVQARRYSPNHHEAVETGLLLFCNINNRDLSLYLLLRVYGLLIFKHFDGARTFLPPPPMQHNTTVRLGVFRCIHR